jgi:N-acetylneuraminic acid mutarotase
LIKSGFLTVVPIGVAILGFAVSSNANVVPATGLWQERAPEPVARQEITYVAAGGRFYQAGGSKSYSYDPGTDTWKPFAALPAKINHMQVAAVGGLVYYIGGLSAWPGPSVGTVYAYNPATNTYTARAPMPLGRDRGGGSAVVYGGKIYVAGGLHAGVTTPWFDVYDPVSDTWTSLPDMPHARDHFQAGIVGDMLYAIGGRVSSASNRGIPYNDAFDFTSGQWETGFAPIPTPRAGFASAVVDGRILTIGGEGPGMVYSTVEAYDPGSNSWTTLAPMPTARHGLQAVVWDGAVYVTGGGTTPNSGTTATNVHEVFMPPWSAQNDVAFSDDFGGGLGPWTATKNVALDSAVFGAAAPSAMLAPSGAQSWASKTLPLDYSSLCLSAGVRLDQHAGNVDVLRFRTRGGVSIGRARVTTGGKLVVRDDVTGATLTTGVALPGGWHTLALCATTGASGTWQLSLDGSVIGSWSANNGTVPIGRIQIGDSATNTYTMHIDDASVSG